MNLFKSVRFRRHLIFIFGLVVCLAALNLPIYMWQNSAEDALWEACQQMREEIPYNYHSYIMPNKYFPDSYVVQANNCISESLRCVEDVKHKLSSFPTLAKAWCSLLSAKIVGFLYLCVAILVLLKVFFGIIRNLIKEWLAGSLMPVPESAVEIMPNGDIVIHSRQLQNINPSLKLVK